MFRMAQALTLRLSRPLPDPAELLRSGLVIGCALALILAGPFLPSL
jgi:hypothetical protein